MNYLKYFSKLISKHQLPEVKTAVILSSGLKILEEEFSQKIILDFSRIKGFPKLSTAGHSAKFAFVKNKKDEYVLLVLGRAHFYENLSPNSIFIMYLFMKCLGVENVISTCSVGAINSAYQPGDIILIQDHINMSTNPLKYIDFEKEKFVSLNNCYKNKISEKIEKIAKARKISLSKGVYIQFSGPSYETPAEINMAKMMGADVVGMSLANESIILSYLEINHTALCMVSNMACGIENSSPSHTEVLKNVDTNSKQIIELLTTYINQ